MVDQNIIGFLLIVIGFGVIFNVFDTKILNLRNRKDILKIFFVLFGFLLIYTGLKALLG